MQTRAKVGKTRKPSQPLRSGRLAVAGKAIAKNKVVTKDPANRRYDIWTLAPDSTGSTPPPASRTRNSKKAANNAVPSEPARPQRVDQKYHRVSPRVLPLSVPL